MSVRSETFGRLLKGAINSIAAYEGKTAPAIEEELGAQLGVAGSAIQRYKAGYLPPESRAIAVFAEAGVRRGFLARAWLARFLQAARYPAPDALLTQLADALGAPAPAAPDGMPGGTLTFLFTDIEGSTTRWEHHPLAMERALARHDYVARIGQQRYEQAVAATRAALGDEAFAAAFAAGKALTLEQAIAEAVAELAAPSR